MPWRPSFQTDLAIKRKDELMAVAKRLSDAILDPSTEIDMVDSLAISYERIQEYLHEINKQNFWKLHKKPVRRKMTKKVSVMDSLRSSV